MSTVQRSGWTGIKNGKLLELAAAEFDVFLTMDRNLEFQQDLAGEEDYVFVTLEQLLEDFRREVENWR